MFVGYRTIIAAILTAAANLLGQEMDVEATASAIINLAGMAATIYFRLKANNVSPVS